jgi:hypothetical protein
VVVCLELANLAEVANTFAAVCLTIREPVLIVVMDYEGGAVLQTD